ncbi:NU5M oxidoreductase, partial [Pseudoatta argentina]
VNRFNYLLLFILSIVLIVIRPNVVRILIGWDGLGMVPYCLVIYYHNYISYNFNKFLMRTNLNEVIPHVIISLLIRKRGVNIFIFILIILSLLLTASYFVRLFYFFF